MLFAIEIAVAEYHETMPDKKMHGHHGDNTQGYLTGKGMGAGKVAESNGYPGPLHVLELADELALNSDQKAQTQAIFDRMKAQAVTLGKELVALEQQLDQQFASKEITIEKLQPQLLKIGEYQARIRQAHVAAHIAERAVLTPEQLKRYYELRGNHHAAHGK